MEFGVFNWDMALNVDTFVSYSIETNYGKNNVTLFLLRTQSR